MKRVNKRITPDFVTNLSRCEIFVFGSNLEGRHAGGAARIAHANIDATIGNTRIVCNQLGYVYYRENLAGFDGEKFIEI